MDWFGFLPGDLQLRVALDTWAMLPKQNYMNINQMKKYRQKQQIWYNVSIYQYVMEPAGKTWQDIARMVHGMVWNTWHNIGWPMGPLPMTMRMLPTWVRQKQTGW